MLSDLRIPRPESYASKRSTPKSSLDIQHRRDVLYVLEDIISTLFPYMVGMILMAIVGSGGLWYNGFFEDPPQPPATIFQQYQGETPPSLGLDLKSPVVLLGSLSVFILSILYIKLP